MAIKLHTDGTVEFETVEEFKEYQNGKKVEKAIKALEEATETTNTSGWRVINKATLAKPKRKVGRPKKTEQGKKRRKWKKPFRNWTPQEDTQVTMLFSGNGRVPRADVKKLADKIDRTLAAVYSRWKQVLR